MPKRTNQFQKLVTYIAEQIAPSGGTVTESALLDEVGIHGKIQREVDVLIEVNAGIAPIRIAIECRDRKPKDDIKWIDELIGKYRNLPINKVVAVSRAGFSKSATKKAELNKITTMSLKEASQTNWPSQFIKLGIALIEQSYTISKVIFETDPPTQSALTADDKVVSPNGSATIPEFLQEVSQQLIEKIHEYVLQNFLTIYKVLADLDKQLVVERRVPVADLSLVTKQGGQHKITNVVFRLISTTSHSKVDVKNALLEDKAMVTTATIPAAQASGNETTIAAVQVVGKQFGKLFIERKKKSTKKNR